MTSMEALPEIVTAHLPEVRALCEKYRVKRLAIFGSAVKGTFDPEKSDLDFVVEFYDIRHPETGKDTYFGLKFALSDLFERKIDLVEWEAVTKPYFRQVVERTQRELYAA
jgi:predicted nucleotidyltransferase